MSDFSARIDTFLSETFELNPTFATSIGEHRHDDRWPDLSADGRAEQLAHIDRWLGEFRAATGLTADEAIDRDLVIGELGAARFAETELREDAWDPLAWVYLIGDGLFTLNAREFAPLADRLASTAGRLEGLPAVLEAAIATLVGTADRPVGQFQTETALKQLPGIDELIADALTAAEAAAPTDPAIADAAPAAQRRGRDRPRRGRLLRTAPVRGRPAGESRRRTAGGGAVRGQDAAHDALGDAHPGAHPRRRRTGVHRGPRGDDPPGPRAVAGLARR